MTALKGKKNIKKIIYFHVEHAIKDRYLNVNCS